MDSNNNEKKIRAVEQDDHAGGVVVNSGSFPVYVSRDSVEEDDQDAPTTTTTTTSAAVPAAHLVPPTGAVSEVEGAAEGGDDDENEEDLDDESEYSYEDEDEGAFSGFLASDSVPTVSNASAASAAVAPARIEQDEEEDADDDDDDAARKSKWKEPTRRAVDMSLRAERETTGSKRRLASELYQIMMRDTKESGFSIAPTREDSMDNWTIKLFQFDQDSMLAKDLELLGLDHVELEMRFPKDYPFEPPFVRVVQPKFKRQTGFVMNGALCMELLTKDGWNPINDIESVIVSIRSLLVVGEGRLQAAVDMQTKEKASSTTGKRKARSAAAKQDKDESTSTDSSSAASAAKKPKKVDVGSYSAQEAESAHAHLSDYHKKKGWDSSGWWAKKG
uniref:UBC core domain-containing protein n=1 Tax=Grammatophora oceanica TaxID=210454 RepID=A0A7S1VM08_9STRA|mmetsp:Transcript_50315/g.75181  ORF Transcript_50315/g.75181 Transcript_50315/m.75181 type:complete len:390 (+) Transcript_50315:186-1355(+)|eukprot:CAMPEP_0194028412 /NCGR_PEP_ID=MMETSP0009_2-20130614/2384_1 /TAXON_ID=210454 /ORGANISM="Grammatophora oceanica, Strain CCMP 410" /LENGTH=389 /DNA_ID=CAMNT_0038667801 /DNA_START=176 /DNA_END=1345 /DNA_ORIENTATION=+